jgi:hypothetical protein
VTPIAIAATERILRSVFIYPCLKPLLPKTGSQRVMYSSYPSGGSREY